MELKSQCLKYLRQALDDPSATFRDGQWEAIRDIVSKQKTLLLVRRTGWGKSMVYFLATRLLRDRGAGPTLLISPLLSLMRNQIEAAKRIGINAETINSSNEDDWNRIEKDIHNGAVDALLISPERLGNDKFRSGVLRRITERAGLFVVDEAHCISDWGHDFRRDYQRIARTLQAMFDNIPVLATTATANDRVVEDVVAQIGSDVQVSRGPLARRSLHLQNIEMKSPTDRMAWLAEYLPKIDGSGIIYTLTTRAADRLSEWLQTQDIDARAYHSKLCVSRKDTNELRLKRERLLQQNKVKALVSTIALGMGFDKPDIGFVIHYQRPGSVVHYYQQVGRAGRDGNPAYGILFEGDEDDEIIDYFIHKAFPPIQDIQTVLKALDEAENGLMLREIQKQVNLRKGDIEEILDYLSTLGQTPVERHRERGRWYWYRTTVQYEPDRETRRRISKIRQQEREEMQRYMQHDGCLMAFLQNALDDPHAGPCGICASCTGGPIIPEDVSESIAIEAAQFLRRSEVPIEPRKQWPYTDSLDAYGWENSGPYGTMEHHLRMEEGRALSIWGDAGWGRLVKQGKYRDGHFDDRLVKAARDMIEDRWKPDAAPQWVTCVPSKNRPELVPDYARRLANALNLPFVQCVQKVKENESQKEMENKQQQTQNLNGVFDVTPGLARNAPALLVDDTVDSKWTMTVVAALLKEAGAGPVYPFALAQTTPTST